MDSTGLSVLLFTVPSFSIVEIEMLFGSTLENVGFVGEDRLLKCTGVKDAGVCNTSRAIPITNSITFFQEAYMYHLEIEHV